MKFPDETELRIDTTLKCTWEQQFVIEEPRTEVWMEIVPLRYYSEVSSSLRTTLTVTVVGIDHYQ